MSDRTKQSRPRSGVRKAYHIDLSDLHAQCEANYHRLMRLFPGYEQQPRCTFEVGDAVVGDGVGAGVVGARVGVRVGAAVVGARVGVRVGAAVMASQAPV